MDRIVHAIKRRQFLIVGGTACSAKTTAWAEAKRRLREEAVAAHFCQPLGLSPRDYNEQTIYRVIKYAISPPDDSRENAFKRSREGRAMQCRQILESQNDQGHPVCLAINDAHTCRVNFLIMCKRLWDDLYGFDRLLAVVLIGQPSLLSTTSGYPEINERTEVVRLPGLGKSLEKYLHHECARCGLEEFPFDETAIEQIRRLARPNWLETRDHPLVVNNVVSRALHDGWRIKAQAVNADLIAGAMRAEKVG